MNSDPFNLDSHFWAKAGTFIINYIPKIIGAIRIYIIGLYLINRILYLIKKTLKTKQYNPTLNIFLLSIFGWILKILLFFVIIDKLGVSMLTFASVLTGISIGIGLAM